MEHVGDGGQIVFAVWDVRGSKQVGREKHRGEVERPETVHGPVQKYDRHSQKQEKKGLI